MKTPTTPQIIIIFWSRRRIIKSYVSHKRQKVTVRHIKQATRNAVDSNNDDLGTSPANNAYRTYTRSILVHEKNILMDLRNYSPSIDKSAIGFSKQLKPIHNSFGLAQENTKGSKNNKSSDTTLLTTLSHNNV